jgi:hypothetical protein
MRWSDLLINWERGATVLKENVNSFRFFNGILVSIIDVSIYWWNCWHIFFIDFVYFVVVFIGNYQQKYFVTFFHQQLPIKYFSQHYWCVNLSTKLLTYFFFVYFFVVFIGNYRQKYCHFFSSTNLIFSINVFVIIC